MLAYYYEKNLPNLFGFPFTYVKLFTVCFLVIKNENWKFMVSTQYEAHAVMNGVATITTIVIFDEYSCHDPVTRSPEIKLRVTNKPDNNPRHR